MAAATTILVVDDEMNNRQIAKRLLQSQGYNVIVANSGSECMASIGEHHPAVIIIDYILPDRSGHDICREIKSDPTLRDTIVILISSYKKSSDVKARCLEAGADAYIVRPIKNREYLANIMAMVRLKSVQDAANRHRKEHAALSDFSQFCLSVRSRKALFDRIAKILAPSMAISHVIALRLAESPKAPAGIMVFRGYSTPVAETVSLPQATFGGFAERLRGADPVAKPIFELPVEVIRYFSAKYDTESFAWCLPVHAPRISCGGILLFWKTSEAVPDEACSAFLQSIANIAVITITRLRNLYELAEAGERRYRTLSEASPAGIVQLDAEGRYVYMNDKWSELTHIPSDNVLGKHWLRSLLVVNRADIEHDWANWDEESDVFRAYFRIPAANGNHTWIHAQMAAEITNGEVIGYIGTFSDVTAWKNAEEELAGEKERLAITLRSIGDGVFTTDTDGRIQMMNSVAESITGWTTSEAVGKTIRSVFKIIDGSTREPAKNPVDEVLNSGTVVGLAENTVLVRKDGVERMVADSAAPIRDSDGNIIGVVFIFSDITERCEIERRMQQSQKMESLGVLAGGIAHDFNNYITAIQSNVSLTRSSLQAESNLIRFLDRANQGCEHAQGLTQQLLTFAKGGKPVKGLVSLTSHLNSWCDFAVHGSSCRAKYSIHTDLWDIEADTGQIQQIIHNLVLNAGQSMPTGGVIAISAENRVLDQDDNPLQLPPGKYTEIAVQDQGSGISLKHRDRIFEPFFTTKRSGGGLGLAIVFSIVKNHGGGINVHSIPGKGTTFQVFLPALGMQLKRESAHKPSHTTISRRILIMDDDTIVRESLKDMLVFLGHQVHATKNGTEAIDFLRSECQSARRLDAAILDLTVPNDCGGKTVVEEIRNIMPHLKVVVSSGYSNDPILANHKDHGFDAVVRKPYGLDRLAETLNELFRINV